MSQCNCDNRIVFLPLLMLPLILIVINSDNDDVPKTQEQILADQQAQIESQRQFFQNIEYYKLPLLCLGLLAMLLIGKKLYDSRQYIPLVFMSLLGVLGVTWFGGYYDFSNLSLSLPIENQVQQNDYFGHLSGVIDRMEE